MMEYAFPLAVSALTPAARRLAFRLGAIDRPGAGKIHTGEVPRLGGVAVAGGGCGGDESNPLA
jgi:UDP-GlcNAc:undecaprenyl-phosphate GlcNAc-1-phosphate transferase